MARDIKTKQTYQFGSVAEKIYTKPESIPVPSKSHSNKTKKALQQKVDRMLGIQLGICGFIIFIGALGQVHSHYALSAKQTMLNNLKSEKVALSNQITKMEAEITKKMDLKMIKEKATEELGMQSPLAYQIVYIDLANESETSYQEVG